MMILPRQAREKPRMMMYCRPTANCIMIIAQFAIENSSEQGQFASSPLKTIGNVQDLGNLQ